MQWEIPFYNKRLQLFHVNFIENRSDIDIGELSWEIRFLKADHYRQFVNGAEKGDLEKRLKQGDVCNSAWH